MSSDIWLKDARGGILINDSMEIILCEVCPCDVTGGFVNTPDCPCLVMPRQLCFRMRRPGGIPEETVLEAILTYNDTDGIWYGSSISCYIDFNLSSAWNSLWTCSEITLQCQQSPYIGEFGETQYEPIFNLGFTNTNMGACLSQGGATWWSHNITIFDQEYQSSINCSPIFSARSTYSILPCSTGVGTSPGIISTLAAYTGSCKTLSSDCSPWPMTPWAFWLLGVNINSYPPSNSASIIRGDGVAPSILPNSSVVIPTFLVWRGGSNYSIAETCRVSEFTPWSLTLRNYNRTFSEEWEIQFEARDEDNNISPCLSRKMYYTGSSHLFWISQIGQTTRILDTSDYISCLSICPGNVWSCPYPATLTGFLQSNCSLLHNQQVTLYHQFINDSPYSPIWSGIIFIPDATSWTHFIHVILDYRIIGGNNDVYGWLNQNPTCRIRLYCGNSTPENLTGVCYIPITGDATIVTQYDLDNIIAQSCSPYLLEFSSEFPSYSLSDWTGLDCASFKTECENAFCSISFQ